MLSIGAAVESILIEDDLLIAGGFSGRKAMPRQVFLAPVLATGM
jgi:hypothetical protein